MGDIKIEYDDTFGMNTFKREIIATCGEKTWNEITYGITLPDINNECDCKCKNMINFMERFENIVESKIGKQILVNVRHGLNPSQCARARDKFLECGNLDEFIKKNTSDEMKEFKRMCDNGEDFYGQPITPKVYEFLLSNYGNPQKIRSGNKLIFSAYPAEMVKYLDEKDEQMKRYYACHCPFAKESILSEKSVSAFICNCSLGHIMNFWEAVFDCKLEGKVISSVLGGDLLCRYEVTIPDEIMREYVL